LRIRRTLARLTRQFRLILQSVNANADSVSFAVCMGCAVAIQEKMGRRRGDQGVVEAHRLKRTRQLIRVGGWPASDAELIDLVDWVVLARQVQVRFYGLEAM
jgi:hypothetical protein